AHRNSPLTGRRALRAERQVARLREIGAVPLETKRQRDKRQAGLIQKGAERGGHRGLLLGGSGGAVEGGEEIVGGGGAVCVRLQVGAQPVAEFFGADPALEHAEDGAAL